MPSPEQLDWLNTVCAPAAVKSERDTGLPAEISCSQAIYESAWGTRGVGLNFFGVKSDAHGSGVDYVMTEEYLNGQWESMPLAFETYATAADSFTDHARLITQGRPYQNAWGIFLEHRDADALMRIIGPIYATGPTYASQMVQEMHSAAVVSAVQAAREAA